DLFIVVAEEAAQELHPLEPLPPRLDHYGQGGSIEGELLVRHGQFLRDLESRLLQMDPELPAHMKIVAARIKGIPSISCEKRSSPLGHRLVPEEIVDFRDGDPASGTEMMFPGRKRLGKIQHVSGREGRPDAISL